MSLWLMSDSLIIAVDFDGTCVYHMYPEIGESLPMCVVVLRALIANGHKLIVWTMRGGEYLQDAVDWFNRNGIELYGINENPTQKSWTGSPKAYAQVYIDDAALGVPLCMPNGTEADDRPYVDWRKLAILLQLRGLLTARQIENMGI